MPCGLNQRRMCHECPFRAKAPAGWLGPYTIDEFEQTIHSEGELACHVSVMRHPDGEDAPPEELEHCVGMLRYRSSVLKRPHDEMVVERMKELKAIEDQPLIPPFKFREYHESGKLSKTRK